MALACVLRAQPGFDGDADLVGAAGRVRMTFAARQLQDGAARSIVEPGVGEVQIQHAGEHFKHRTHHPVRPFAGPQGRRRDQAEQPVDAVLKSADFGGRRTLNHSCHACALFRDREEEYSVLMPFAREGYERGEKLFQVVDADHRPERLRRLADAGVAPDEADPAGHVEVRPWEATYLRGGRFNQNAMLELIQEALQDGKAGGYGLTRLWANMEWALEELPGVENLLEYETRLNHVLPQYDAVAVCTYDLSKFSASVLVDVLRTHPWAIVGKTLQQNPFYIPPDQMLREIRGRA